VFIVKFPVTVVVADVATSLVNRAIALNIMLEVRFIVKVGLGSEADVWRGDSGVTSHRQPRQCRGARAQNGKRGPR